MNTGREMPRYQCHKKVWALKIAEVKLYPVRIVPADAGYAEFQPATDWIERYKGGFEDDAGYYVVYEDGYASWSPSKAFEEGYSRL